MWPEKSIPAFFTQAYWTLSRAKIMWLWTVVYLGGLDGLSLLLTALYLGDFLCQVAEFSCPPSSLRDGRKRLIRGYTPAITFLTCLWDAGKFTYQRRGLWLTHWNGLALQACTTLDPRTRSLLIWGDIIIYFILDNYDVSFFMDIALWLFQALFFLFMNMRLHFNHFLLVD